MYIWYHQMWPTPLILHILCFLSGHVNKKLHSTSVCLKQLVVTWQTVTKLYTDLYRMSNSLDFQSQWLTMDWTVWELNPGGAEISHSHPDQHWGLPNVLYNGDQVSFPEEKVPGHGVEHPPPSSAKVKKRVELYIYSISGPSRPLVGWNIIMWSGSNCLLLMLYTNPICQIFPTVLIREASRFCLKRAVTLLFLVKEHVYNTWTKYSSYNKCHRFRKKFLHALVSYKNTVSKYVRVVWTAYILNSNRTNRRHVLRKEWTNMD